MLSELLGLTDSSREVLTAVVLSSAAKLAGLYLVAHTHRAKFEKIGTVASLYIYPLKSCGVLETKQAKVTNVGLEWESLIDRQWMILDTDAEPITMKEEPRLSLIRCTAEAGKLQVHAPDMPVLELSMRPDLNGATPYSYMLTGQEISVVDCGNEARKWISHFLGRSAYIVFSCPDLGTRDAFLRKRKWDNEAKSGDLDNWKEIVIGDQSLFHTVEPCRRCVITTIEPETANKRKDIQPLKLLRSFRCRAPYGASPLFGVYFSNDFPGCIKVGDPVYALRR